jgi:hypothetical protein
VGAVGVDKVAEIAEVEPDDVGGGGVFLVEEGKQFF